MHDVADLVFDLDVRDLESAECMEHPIEYVIARAAARARRAKFAAKLAQLAQHACAIEPLSVTVFAEAHVGSLHRRLAHSPRWQAHLSHIIAT